MALVKRDEMVIIFSVNIGISSNFTDMRVVEQSSYGLYQCGLFGSFESIALNQVKKPD
jgi:hypothetical protein